MKFLVTLVLLSISPLYGDDLAEAKKEAQTFSESMLHLDSKAMVGEFHSRMTDFFSKMILRICEKIDNDKERKEFLTALKVKNIDELKHLDKQTQVIRFYNYSFARTSDQYKEISKNATMLVIGAIPEGDFIHVLTRMETNINKEDYSVPSVVTLQKEDGKWKVLSTTQFETMRADLKRQGF